MSDTDLEGVVVEPSNQGTSTTFCTPPRELEVNSDSLLDNHPVCSSRGLSHRCRCLEFGFGGGERR